MAPASNLPLAAVDPIILSLRPRENDGTLGESISLQVIVEAWAQGFNVGGLILLVLLVLCNYRRHVLLHKLILLEVSQGENTSLGSLY